MPPKKRAAKDAAKDDAKAAAKAKRELDALRRKHTDFFHYYRRGELNKTTRRKVKLASQRDDLGASHEAVQDEPLPSIPLQRYVSYYHERAELKKAEGYEESEDEDERTKPQWRTSKGLAKDMYEKGAGLHFCKILGAGGMGIICVFVSYDKNQSPTFWTVKRDTGRLSEIVKEKETTLRFLRAPHIVQVFDSSLAEDGEEDREEDGDEDGDEGNWSPPPSSKRPKTGQAKTERAKTERTQAEVRKETRANRAGQKAASIARKAGTAVRQPQTGPTDQVDQVPKSMVMEYLIRGSLYRWFDKLGKLKYEKEPDLCIPNRVLWDMMACFMKMCMAMEYHPLQVHPEVNDGGYMIPEKVGAPPGTGLVHFDIDPQNVLIGDFDWEKTTRKVASTHPQFETMTDKHDRTPIFKLIDFGLACEMKPGDPNRRDLENLWHRRKYGKPGYYVPEQFTREWDAVVDSPDVQNARVAGQYSWKSNLWQFGMIMHIAITLRWNPKHTIHNPGRVNLICRNDKPLEEQTTERLPIYGAHLLDQQYDQVPLRLRHLVARCLCEYPEHRPSFEELHAEIQRAWDDENKEEMEAARQWCQRHFERPPNPSPPPWMQVEDWAKQKDILELDKYLKQ
ncbi:kinase-like domain-containing protein [Copromyces sp. CBS 386.78]|nr:kinase-like domain-containing protein [Copromyces sp. CBS 386.78]